MKKTILILAALITCLPARSQNAGVDMADAMRADGKIYVVAGVVAIIFTVILAYLVRLDRRISAAERKLKNKTET